jgi:hypothetical protein
MWLGCDDGLGLFGHGDGIWDWALLRQFGEKRGAHREGAVWA